MATSAVEAARAAAQHLTDLTGREIEGVVGLERTDDGWLVRLEVLELRRIPDSTDLLALYDIDLDDAADLTGYTRVGRYARGESRKEGSQT